MKALLVAALTVGCYAVPSAPVIRQPVGPEPAFTAPPPPWIPVSSVESAPADPESEVVAVPEAVPEDEPVPPENIEDLWLKVETAADSLATKRWQIRLAKEHFNKGPKNEQAIKSMEKHYDAIVAEEFCPAAVEFRVRAGARQYNKRAVLHCKTSAPVATGLSGKQITLTEECAMAFATQCSVK